MVLARRMALAALVCTLSVSPAFAQNWVASWGAGQTPKVPAEKMSSAGITYRNIARMSLGGKQVRVTLSNRYGKDPLRIDAVTVARSTGKDNVTSVQPVTFLKNQTSITLAPGQEIISNPVALDVPPLSDVAVSFYLPSQKIQTLTSHALSHQQNYWAAGNQVGKASLSGVGNLQPWHVVTAVDVAGPSNGAAIVTIGDSITDGAGTDMSKNQRWSNHLAERLQADPKYRHLAVVNEGIGSDRILYDGGGADTRTGLTPALIKRWDYDALQRSGVKYVIVLEGVNDIGRYNKQQPVTTGDALINAMKNLVKQAHAKGIKVIGATLTPFKDARYWSAEGQKIHEQVNDFIRNGKTFDGYVDFEKAVEDPNKPGHYLAKYDHGDGLHPSPAGTQALANSIPLSLFDK